MSAGRRAAVVVGIVVLLVVGVVLTASESTSPTAPPTVPSLAADGAPSTWYCAEGTANPGGRANEQVLLGNVGRQPMRARVTVNGGAEVVPVTRELVVPAGRVQRVPVSSIAPIAEPGVVVETTGGRAAITHRLDGNGDTAVGPCSREPNRIARFAAGTTAKGAQLWLALMNPYPDDAIVDVSALTESGVRGPAKLRGIVVPRLSRISVALHDALPRVDTVATQVRVRQGRAIVEESQTLDGTDGRRGLTLALGQSTSKAWRFPFGVVGSGHQERLVVANPDSRETEVTVRFALDAAAAVEPLRIVVPPASVVTPDLARVPPGVGFSVTVTASRPIVAETVGASGAPQAPDVRGLAADLGISEPARTWAVAPARLDARSTDSVAVMSADGRAHRVSIVRADVPTRRRFGQVRVPATGRAVIDVAKIVPGPDIAFLLVADGPVVVARDSVRPGFTRSHAIAG